MGQKRITTSHSNMVETEQKIKSMVFENGLSYKEIANKLKLDLGFVMSIAKTRSIKQQESSDISASCEEGGIDMDEEKVVVEEDMVISVRKKHKYLTKEEVTEVCNLLELGEKVKDIAEAFDVAPSTVYRIKDKMKDSINDNSFNEVSSEEKEDVVLEEISEPSNEESANNNTFDEFHKYFGLDKIDGIFKINDANTIEVGLVADRHLMPVDKFIFDGPLSEDLMFDFAEQENICREWIHNNMPVDSNGNIMNTLIVYTSGLQSALGSVIKTCNDLHVALSIKHYNARTKMYLTQPIFNSDKCLSNNERLYLNKFGGIKLAHGLFYYKNLVDLNNPFYFISISEFGEENVMLGRGGILCGEYSDVWEIYPKLIQSINGISKNLAVFVNESRIENDKFAFGNNITKGYNFK